jgi:hypothetical protein
MAEIRAVVARLNPQAPKTEIGNGGLPSLTQADIAGALGMVKESLGREIFCALWWPDGAKLTAEALDAALEAEQWRKFRELMDAMVTAQIAVAHAEIELDGTHGRMGTMHAQYGRAKGMLEEARANMWPRISPTYVMLRRAVIAELQSPNLCKQCVGRGSVRIGERLIVCQACNGTAHKSASYRDRARAIGKERTQYFEGGWRRAYDWTFHRFASLENDAARELRIRLFGGIEPPPKKSV